MDKIFLLLLLTLSSMSLSAQDLSQHKWQDRLLLIFSDHEQNELYQKQINTFQQAAEGLKERKLFLYTFQQSAGDWTASNKIFKKYKKKKAPFEIILIGLDGRVKLRQITYLSTLQLFAIIDAMPMRQQELRQSGNE